MTVVIDRRRHIDAEADRFAAALAASDPQARVPTCPGWTALDLLAHLTEVHQFWAAVIGDRLTGAAVGAYEENRASLPTDPALLQELRRRATADLLTALEARDPAEEAWSWFGPDQSVGFTWRMQTHEATMHRVDAELTAGEAISPIEEAVAVDGIDHMIDVMWAWAPADARCRATGTVALHATDTDRSWQLETFRWSGEAWGQTFVDQPGCRRTGGTPGAAADAVVSGRSEDLDLLVWTRADRGVARAGDPAVLAEFQAVLDAGVQ